MFSGFYFVEEKRKKIKEKRKKIKEKKFKNKELVNYFLTLQIMNRIWIIRN